MLPLFHPTTTILVDDVPSYLESFRDAAPLDLPVKTFEFPEDAILSIKKQNEAAREKFNRFLKVTADTNWEVVDNTLTEEIITRVSLSGLKNKLLDRERFNEVSVIICDYAMPSMKGTDFFEKLGNIPQKRILLTGEADANIAVKAFNDGLIDQFITKGRSGGVVDLFNQVRRYQRDYFRHQYSFLAGAYLSGESLFASTAFEKLVANLSETHGFVEHYYVNFPNGAILIDEGRQRKRLVALTEDDYKAHLDSAKDFGDQELLNALRTKAVVLNESYGEGVPGGLSYWREMSRPTEVFEFGGETLYYALFDLRDEVDQDRIQVFSDFTGC